MRLQQLPKTRSIWEMDLDRHPRLEGIHRADVAVVGAGITGMTAATALAMSGRRVVVIDAGTFGKQGTSHRTSAHLTALPDQSLQRLIRRFGADAVQSTVAATTNAIDLIEAWCRQLRIEADFRRVDAWRYTESAEQDDEQDIKEDGEHCRQLGLTVEFGSAPLPFPTRVACRIGNQGAFHPIRYIDGLARYVESRPGCAVFTKSPVRTFEDAEPCRVQTDHGRVECRHVVLATHSPLGVWLTLHPRLVPMRTYCMAVKVDAELPDALYWDNADPYHYTRRVAADMPDTLVIGGADHKTGDGTNTAEPFAELERYVRDRFGRFETLTTWSAEFFDPADGMPYIGLGAGSQRVYVATGYSGCGLTLGTAAGTLIVDLIEGRERQWAEVVSPSRVKPVASMRQTVKELAVTGKGMVIDRLFRADGGELDDLAPGSGKVIRRHGRSVAVHRDAFGRLHACSAVCTHMGCVVRWNQAEQHWDCPCHGSIFKADGGVMAGPAEADLEPLESEFGEAG